AGESGRHAGGRRPAGHSLGLSLDAEPTFTAGVVWRRLGLYGLQPTIGRPRMPARHVPTLVVFPLAGGQPANGAGEGGHADRASVCVAGDGRRRTRPALLHDRGGVPPHARCHPRDYRAGCSPGATTAAPCTPAPDRSVPRSNELLPGAVAA